MTRSPVLTLLLVLSILAACAARAAEPSGTTTVILVRHAEKASGSGDPDLSESGRARARELARVLADVRLEALYATQYLRTRRTLEPIAEQRGLEVRVDPVEGGDLPGYARRFAAALVERHAGGTVLVAGHSNTVPQLIEALGVTPAPAIDETDYDDLFVVLRTGEGEPTLLHLHYGASSPGP